MDAEIPIFSDLQEQQSALNDLPTQVTEFLVSARAAQENLRTREKILEQRLAASEHYIDTELSKIHGVINHFQELLDRAGARDWRVAAESLYKEGKQPIHGLQTTFDDIKKSVKEACTHVDNASTQILKGLTKTLGTLNTNELEQLAEDSGQEIKTVANAAIQQINEIGQWFSWKNLVFVLVLSVVVVLFMDLFIDDEWPWESHKNATKERVAGQALLQAWPQLSLSDQQRIMNYVS